MTLSAYVICGGCGMEIPRWAAGLPCPHCFYLKDPSPEEIQRRRKAGDLWWENPDAAQRRMEGREAKVCFFCGRKDNLTEMQFPTHSLTACRACKDYWEERWKEEK